MHARSPQRTPGLQANDSDVLGVSEALATESMQAKKKAIAVKQHASSASAVKPADAANEC